MADSFEYTFRKIIRVKFFQVLYSLSQTDVFNRHVELIGDGQNDAALGRAVELRQDDACDVRRFAELRDLGYGVLSCGRIEDAEIFILANSSIRFFLF